MQRIFGSECEYAVTGRGRWKRRGPASHDPVVRRLVEAHGQPRIGQYLGNGARCYPDVNAHPEWATAEVLTPDELIAHERAGELILASAARRLGSVSEYGNRPVMILKNNHDVQANSWGSHENYLVSRRVSIEHLSDWLSGFLTSRYIWSGAGALITSRAQARYAISGRALDVRYIYGTQTTRERPLINLRDEPLGNAARYRRVHFIMGDSNMSDWVTWLKFAVTHLVLRSYEARIKRGALVVADVRKACHGIAYDLDLVTPISLVGRARAMSALDMQYWYADAVAKLLARDGGEPWEHEALQRWLMILEMLESGWQSTIGILEWSTKLSLLESVASRARADFDHPKIQTASCLWHDIDPEYGFARRFEQTGRLLRAGDDAAVLYATTNPPQTTRARSRGYLVQAAVGLPSSANWMHVHIGETASRSFDRSWKEPADPDYAV